MSSTKLLPRVTDALKFSESLPWQPTRDLDREAVESELRRVKVMCENADMINLEYRFLYALIMLEHNYPKEEYPQTLQQRLQLFLESPSDLSVESHDHLVSILKG
jgi:hypothetical protein